MFRPSTATKASADSSITWHPFCGSLGSCARFPRGPRPAQVHTDSKDTKKQPRWLYRRCSVSFARALVSPPGVFLEFRAFGPGSFRLGPLCLCVRASPFPCCVLVFLHFCVVFLCFRVSFVCVCLFVLVLTCSSLCLSLLLELKGGWQPPTTSHQASSFQSLQAPEHVDHVTMRDQNSQNVYSGHCSIGFFTWLFTLSKGSTTAPAIAPVF